MPVLNCMALRLSNRKVLFNRQGAKFIPPEMRGPAFYAKSTESCHAESEGQQTFLWALLTKGAERPRLLRSALQHIGRILIVALVLDTIYQLIVFKMFYPAQAVIVAVTCAVVPYVLFRGLAARLGRLLRRKFGAV